MKRFVAGIALLGLFVFGVSAVSAADVTLLAGRTEPVGEVEVTNDGENLSVKYSLNEGWGLEETHLHVACGDESIPTNRPGNPIVGHFEYKQEDLQGAPSVEFKIPLEDEGAEPGNTLTLAAHAVVRSDKKEESAWAEGEPFRKRGNWAMYFTYEVKAPDPEPADNGHSVIDLGGSDDSYTAVRTFPDDSTGPVTYTVTRQYGIEFSAASPALGEEEASTGTTDRVLIRTEREVVSVEPYILAPDWDWSNSDGGPPLSAGTSFLGPKTGFLVTFESNENQVCTFAVTSTEQVSIPLGRIILTFSYK